MMFLFSEKLRIFVLNLHSTSNKGFVGARNIYMISKKILGWKNYILKILKRENFKTKLLNYIILPR